MRMAPEIKYTDRDVRENDELRELAERYVRDYGGEFDPLLRANNMLSMDGALTTTMARVVLNCMRYDENVAVSMPEPKGYTMPHNPRVRREPAEPKRVPRVLQVCSNTHYRQRYALRGRLKFDYVINLHKQAKWYHKIDHARTRFDFYPQDWPADHWGEANTLKLRELRGVCGEDLTRAVGVTKFLGTIDDAEESDNEFCPRCKFGHRDASWKP